MKKLIIAMHDSLVDQFNVPITMETDKAAINSYLYTIKNEPYLKANADQYALWQLGTFDAVTGKIEPATICLMNEAATAIAVKEENHDKNHDGN